MANELGNGSSRPFFDRVVERASDTDIVGWRDIENNEGVQEAVVPKTFSEQVETSAPENCERS